MTENKERLGQERWREVEYKQVESERRRHDERLNKRYRGVKIKREDE